MSTTISRTAVPAVLFLLIFVSGFWLSRAGRPYSMIGVNVHKLISLGTVAFLAVTVYRLNQATSLSPLHLIAFWVTILFFVATIVSGGLMSIDRPMPPALAVVHHYFPYLTLLSSAGTLYLLNRLVA